MRTIHFQPFILFLFLSIFVKGQECLDVTIRNESGSENVYINCENGLNQPHINLTVEYTNIPSTDEYNIESIDYSPVINFNNGIALSPEFETINSNVIDDKFSPAVNIGFPFCFYNEKYTKLVIGSNGILSFNIDNANAICPARISATNPNPSLITNSIFGVQNDLIFDNDESEIYYSTIGTSPCRKFIVNYYKAKLIGCDEYTTFQIVLHETSNKIDVIIKDKPENCHTGSAGFSLIGILNDFGDNGISPPNRNMGYWNTSLEAWSFIPSGNIPPVISWFNSDNEFIDYGEQIQLTPTENTFYKAEIKYASCNENDTVFSDNITVEFDPYFPLIKKESIYICENNLDSEGNITLSDYSEQILYNPTTNFSIAYYGSLNDAENQQNAINNYNITQETSFFVRVESNISSLCYIIKEIRFVFTSTILDNIEFKICDINNDGIEEQVNIQEVFQGILAANDINEFQVFSSQANAESETNPITISDVSPTSVFWLNISSPNEDCLIIQGPIHFEFLPSPVLENIPTITYTGCDINSDNFEEFDWGAEISNLIDIPDNVSISVHETEENALNNVNALNAISNTYSIVYIRVTNTNGCYNVYPINTDVNFSGMVISNHQDRICFDGTEDITINLDDYYEEMIDEYDGNFSHAYFQTSSNAENNVNPINNIQTITEDGRVVYVDYYVRFSTSEDCYSVKRFRMYLMHPKPFVTEVPICDIYSENVPLSLYNSLIMGFQTSSGTITYYASLSNAENNISPINTHTFSEAETLYVKIERFGCVGVFPINFYITNAPDINQNININIESCNSDQETQTVNLTLYNDVIYSGQLNPQIVFYETYNSGTGELTNIITSPTSYEAEENTTIYASINFNGETCNLIVPINFRSAPHEPITFNGSNLYSCDLEQDLNETFNLENGIEQLIQDIPNFNLAIYEITYYNSLENAESKTDPLSTTFSPNQSEYNIYVRFENRQSECYDIGIIVLNTIESPKIFQGNYTSCDLDGNGVNDIILQDLIPIVSATQNNFTYTYHLSESDATNEINGITESIYENTTSLTEIWVRAENISDCYGIAKVNISEGIQLSISQNNFILNKCDFDLNGFESFDLSEIITQLSLTTESFNFYTTQDDIRNNNPISDYNSYTNTQSGGETIYLKVTNNDSCPAFATIDLTLNTPPQVNLNNVSFCETEDLIISPEIIDTSISYTYEWYNANNELISNNLELQGNYPPGIYKFIIKPNNVPTCYGTYEVEATISSIQTSSEQFILQACDLNGNGIQTFNLNDIQNQLNANQNIQGFYLSNNLENPITNPNSFDNSTPYNQSIFVLISGSSGCPKFYETLLNVNQLNTDSATFTLQACDLNGNGIQTFNLNDLQNQLNANQNIQGFYLSNNLENPITNPNTFDNSTPYNQSIFVLINESSGCPKFYETLLNVNQLNTDSATFTLQACDLNGNGIQTFNLNDLQNQLNANQNIQGFYLSNNLENPITNPNSFDNSTPYNQSIFVLISGSSGCPKFYETLLNVNLISISNQSARLLKCNANGNGINSFNLTEIQSQLEPNQSFISFHTDQSLQTTINSPTEFSNSTPYQDMVYALVTVQGSCPKKMPIYLEIIPDPEITINETAICIDSGGEIFAEISNPNNHYQFEWIHNNTVISNSLNSGEISESGSYTLNVTTDIDNSCSYSFQTNVTLLDPPVILDLSIYGSTVQVIANGSNSIEYSMDNNGWQSSNTFSNIPNGSHQFFVRYINLGCVSAPKGAYIVDMHDVLTPNNDGVNDEIRFSNLSIYNGEKITLSIYSRKGKLVYKAESDTEIIWNGKINGQALPTGDYWYFLNLPDGQKFNGHITIKNK